MLQLTILKPHYREVVLFKAYAGLRAEASRTYLSILWWVLEPILSMTVYYVVFGLLFKGRTQDYVPFLLTGLVTWQWFANSVKHSMNTIRNNARLINQVDFPKVMFPTIELVKDGIKFLFVFALLLVFLWLYGFDVGISYLALPIVLLVQFVLTAMFAYLAAAVIPFVPDLKFVVDTTLHLVFFLSGIFFSGASIPEKYRAYFYLNPMANLIESYRHILMLDQWPDWTALSTVALFALIGIYFAHLLFERLDHIYPRLVDA